MGVIRKAFTYILTGLAIAMLLYGCDTGDSDTNPVFGATSNSAATSGPKFTIVDREYGMTTYGRPKVTITVRNTGNATGYNVACDVQAKKNNTIIDSGFAYFANGGNIAPGEKAQEDAIFFELTSLDGYELTYDLTWLEPWN